MYADLTRAMILREFRDYVLQKNGLQDPHHGGGRHHSNHQSSSSSSGVASPLGAVPFKIFQPDNVILVGARTAGAAGGTIIEDLCSLTKAALSIYEEGLQKSSLPDHIKLRKFRVECVVPAELTFLDEIKQARKAKILVTLHGTISYLSLFARDGTQQISIANPKEYKENQILLYATHTQLHYLNWDRIKELHKVLTHAITLSNIYYFS